MDDSTSYDAVLLVDFDPPPHLPFASYESLAKCGIDTATKLKLSRNFRLRPQHLPIYENVHSHHIVAKIDVRCSTNDRQNAARFVNEHIRNALKANMTTDAIILSVVETFPSRVVKGLNYGAMNEPISKFGTSSKRAIPTQFSSSETDGILNEQVGKKKKKQSKKTADDGHAALALPHDGNPSTPFTVIASVPHPSTDIPDLMDLLNGQYVPEVDVGRQATPPSTTPSGSSTGDAANSVVVRPPAAKVRRTAANEPSAATTEARLDMLDQQLHTNLQRIHKGILYLTGEVETFREEYKIIARKLDKMTENTIATKLASDHTFPMSTLEELEAYMEQDPKLTILIER